MIADRGTGIVRSERPAQMTTHAVETSDPSNGYEAVAAEFMRRRGQSNIGVAEVLRWSRILPSGAAILDLGCGHGDPLAMALAGKGFNLYGVDASSTLVNAFRERLPGADVTCCSVEKSEFFSRRFDGVLAIGLIFLLNRETQRELIHKVAQVLIPGGGFLFTAPADECEWTDVLTDRASASQGREAYKSILNDVGLVLSNEFMDEGENHYFDVRKRTTKNIGG